MSELTNYIKEIIQEYENFGYDHDADDLYDHIDSFVPTLQAVLSKIEELCTK